MFYYYIYIYIRDDYYIVGNQVWLIANVNILFIISLILLDVILDLYLTNFKYI